MDQDSFRKLLENPRKGDTSNGKTKPQTPRNSGAQPKAEKQPAFKPRKVKKQSESDYRDRAAERRLGLASDFAGVEAVLETFEKQTANNEDKAAVEEQRRYLGGDSEHSVLVKGLDYALLEQTLARAAAATEVDDSLEDVFRAATVTTNTLPQKRTRADLVRELKEKREKGVGVAPAPTTSLEAQRLEEAKKAGKFKPIGFKAIGDSADKCKKTRGEKSKDKEGVRKKKKRKIAEGAEGTIAAKGNAVAEESKEAPLPPAFLSTPDPPHANIPPPEEEIPDIFADAGDYEGINFDDDDDEGEDGPSRSAHRQPSEEALPFRKWIEDDEPPREKHRSPTPPEKSTDKGKARATDPEHGRHDVQMDEEEDPPMKLVPLASSALPSIKDVLAADSALEAEQKRKARKEKKKGGGGGGGGEGSKKSSTEAKINRDYQKLKSYTDKKTAAS